LYHTLFKDEGYLNYGKIYNWVRVEKGMKMIDFGKIERKWQKRWEKEKAFAVTRNQKEKYYVLDMFPYPSGEGLHIGHAFVFTLGDIYARFKRLQGFNVLYPMGYDALGLPAENAAIKYKEHPMDYNKRTTANFMKQQKAMGWSYDWNRIVRTDDSDFYKWDQWIFLKMFERGLAYRKKSGVNWCGKCQTVLANEQVVNGRCWRHEEQEVEVKQLEQWFLKITDYADELVDGLDKLDWSERAKKLQRNWIGRSEGTEVDFDVNGNLWKVFTTRVDTLFGVTFLVISAQHPELMSLVTKEQETDVRKFLKKIKSTKQEDMDKLEKEGVFTGSYAQHPLTGEEIPIWTGNFVVADYGSGMVMAVPGHDERDYDFAKKYQLEIKKVVEADKLPFSGYGVLVNSEGFDGLKSEEAKNHITNALQMKNLGRKKKAFRLRDWLISRQRYWGTPIPIIYCDKCGIQTVREKDLPVKLPKKVEFGKGNPLLTNESWIKVKCPKCSGGARRETDTMDTFANSSWYFLRYTDSGNNKRIFDSKKANYWMPVDFYIGGPEHITMHLIYARFYTKFLRDLGLIQIDEPVRRYFTQGIVHAKDGEKMSKSRGNVIEPLKIIEKYGADTLRLFLVSVASSDKDFNWSDKGIEGSLRFLMRVMKHKWRAKKSDERVEHYVNKSIKEIAEDIEYMKYNLAVIKLRKVFDVIESGCSKKDMESFVKMLSVFCPHVGEELWSRFGKGLVSKSSWPKFDEKKINDSIEKADEALSKTVNDIAHVLKLIGKGEKVYVYVLPQEVKNYDEGFLSEKVGLPVKVFAVNDSKKYDPQGKSKKVKPGRPGIFVE